MQLVKSRRGKEAAQDIRTRETRVEVDIVRIKDQTLETRTEMRGKEVWRPVHEIKIGTRASRDVDTRPVILIMIEAGMERERM